MKVHEGIFDLLDKCRDELPEDEAKRTVDEIIRLLQQKEITYGCAHNILRATSLVLDEMQERLSL